MSETETGRITMTVHSDSDQFTSEFDATLPRISLLTMLRLGLFQMGLGMMSLLTLGVLNRIMIDELKVLPWVAAGSIAMHQFVSPARIWFGQRSDSKPLWGLHRTGYVWMGAALFTSLSFIALQVIWQLGGQLQATGWGLATYGWASVLAFVFALYGLALSASSTPFAALLVDISDEDNRSKLISVVWSMLMIGIVVGAIVSSSLLPNPEDEITLSLAQLQSTVTPVFIIVPVVVLVLALVATVGVEKQYSRYATRSSIVGREDQMTLGRSLQVLTASRQTGIFFSFLLILTLSLFMQDAVLEPYGGEVFGLSIAETTQLNAFFGIGTLVGIGSTGFLLLPKVGKETTTKIGCITVAACLGLFILSGMVEDAGLLRGSLLGFGLGSGVITAGATSLMLDLTIAETAGTFIGAWGLSQAMARGLATLLGGAVLNIGKAHFTTPLIGYAMVFGLQALGMLLAVVVLGRVNIKEFQTNAKETVTTVLTGDLDG